MNEWMNEWTNEWTQQTFLLVNVLKWSEVKCSHDSRKLSLVNQLREKEEEGEAKLDVEEARKKKSSKEI